MKFYRYDSKRYATMDVENGLSFSGPDITLELTELNLYRETPQGYWIGYGQTDRDDDGNPTGFLFSDKRWVSKTSKKRYAYPTKEEALESFIARKRRQKRILKAHLEECEDALQLGLTEQKNNELKLGLPICSCGGGDHCGHAWNCKANSSVAELVDASDLKSGSHYGSVGSTPIGATDRNMNQSKKHPKCKGYSYETQNGTEYDCGYDTKITCDECKYLLINKGRGKDPQAKINQLK